MLRVLMNRYNAKDGNQLLKLLPEEESQNILSQSIRSTDLMPILFQPYEFIERLHYSWLKPFIERFPKELHSLLISSLTAEQMTGLAKIFKVSITPVSKPVRTFLLNHLYKLLDQPERLPIPYLPESEFSVLLQWNKKRLAQLIDFLSLHDLASEIKRIVDKNILKNLYSCLNEQELYYLKVCLHQKEQMTTPKLEFDVRSQDGAQLRQVLHQRGLMRLSKGLSGQHPDLIWYLAHTLDVGRGKILLKYYTEEPLPKITPILKSQVLNLINFLNKKSPT